MTDPSKIIIELESNNSRLFKESVIEKNLHNEEFQEGLSMCLDPLITFGVKQVPESKEKTNHLSWKEFKEKINLLVDREKTGHAARDLIIELMKRSSGDQWNNWYRRILIKDLRCGVSQKTVNNVAKRMNLDFSIPVFSCMLAHDGAKHPKKIIGECLVEYKYDELIDALEKLSAAIKKIDEETKTRFKNSFDAVNARIKEVFPKLFGGGFAELSLTENDTLNAGVVLMARPPGKKNTSISQLSGGEKALTALALVFSIFELNPAPFCMLDEVDAPLDDENTVRFINLVSEMSSKVQFIFVTHNKISMEKSTHLLGVTMRDLGVSKVVSVDVEQAMELTQS